MPDDGPCVGTLADVPSHVCAASGVVPISFGGQGDDEHHDMATLLWASARDKLPEMRLSNDERTVA